MRRRYFLDKLILIIGLILLCLVSISLGVAKISIKDTAKILLSKIPLIGNYINLEGIAKSAIAIIWNLRTPRVIMALLVGMGLSICGGVYQGMFKNQMADPYVLGISSGAAFFASIAIVFGSLVSLGRVSTVAAFAFIGSVITTALVYLISRTGGRLPPATLLLTGVAFHFLMSAGINFLLMFNRSMADRIVLWNMGSLSNSNWQSVYIAFPIILVSSLLLIFNAKNLNLLSIDEPTAKSLGLDVEKNKLFMLIVTALIVAVSVSACGIIGFVGLVIPHITRMLYEPDHRVLLPFSGIFGAIFLVACDLAARNFMTWVKGSASEMPVGAITAAFGAPFFIWLIIKRKKRV